MNDNQDNRYGRLEGLVNLESLARRRMIGVGLGSMGHPIVNQLARHGVATQSPGRLRVIDGDLVVQRNLIGTEYLLEHVGMSKAEATAQIVHKINPDVNLSYWNRQITDDDVPAIADMAARSDLLGLFADSFETMLAIADRCADVCPQVMAVFGPNADYAEVAFSIPGQTLPLSKTLGKRKRQTISSPRAFGCDTAYVAAFVAALCIELLLNPSDQGKLIRCYADAPLFLLGLRKTWVFANDPEDVSRIITCVHISERRTP